MHVLAVGPQPVRPAWDAGNSTFARNLEGFFIAAQQGHVPPDQLLDAREAADFFRGNERRVLQVLYQSLSGKDYASLVEFSPDGQPLRTWFVER